MAMERAEKRDRLDSGADSLDSKRARVDSAVSDGFRSDKVRDNLLEIFEEELDVEPQIQGLESVIRSLEEEINPSLKKIDETVALNELDDIELEFLLQASDNELGLPPTESLSGGVGSEIGLTTENLTGEDSTSHEIGGENSSGGDLVTCDGLFEYGGCSRRLPCDRGAVVAGINVGPVRNGYRRPDAYSEQVASYGD